MTGLLGVNAVSNVGWPSLWVPCGFTLGLASAFDVAVFDVEFDVESTSTFSSRVGIEFDVEAFPLGVDLPPLGDFDGFLRPIVDVETRGGIGPPLESG